MLNCEVRQAVPADARNIGALRARNWEEQYAQLPGVTKQWMVDEIDRIAGADGTLSRAHWIGQSANPGATNFWLVAQLIDGSFAGFLEARKHGNGTQELRSLHLATQYRGKGIGQVLMDYAHEWFDPTVPIFLDVAKANEAGQRFYHRAPNNYFLSGHRFFYGPIAMLQMVRKA